MGESSLKVSNVQNGRDSARAAHFVERSPRNVQRVAPVQNGPLDALNFDDVHDTEPARFDVETGRLREDEISATGWKS